jgi:hypothetical protein
MRGVRRRHGIPSFLIDRRIAIPYVAFEVQAAIDLRARAGRMIKKFNEFENNKIQGKQIDFSAKGRTRQLRKIVDSLARRVSV